VLDAAYATCTARLAGFLRYRINQVVNVI
jgi:hypothetical protein